MLISKTLYYIQDIRYYHNYLMLFCKIGNKDLTSNLVEAALFSEEQAKRICSRKKFFIAWTETYIKKNTQLTVNKNFIEKGRSRWKKIKKVLS